MCHAVCGRTAMTSVNPTPDVKEDVGFLLMWHFYTKSVVRTRPVVHTMTLALGKSAPVHGFRRIACLSTHLGSGKIVP